MASGVFLQYLYATRVERISQVDSINSLFPNVNVNHNHNVNNDNVTYKDKKQRAAEVRSTANKIADTLKEPQNIKFFYKAAWNLPESIIWTNLEQSLTKKNPGAYFVTLCKLEMSD